MEQLEFFDIPSPCVGRCQLNRQGYCIGCYRSRQERLEWHRLSNGQRQVVLRLCRQRCLRNYRASKKDASLLSRPPSNPTQLSLFD